MTKCLRCACSHNGFSVKQGLVNDQHLLYGSGQKGRFYSTSQRSIPLGSTIGTSFQSPCLSKQTVHLNPIGFSGMAKARHSFLPCEAFFTCRLCSPVRASLHLWGANLAATPFPFVTLSLSNLSQPPRRQYDFQQARNRCFKHWPIPMFNLTIRLLSYKLPHHEMPLSPYFAPHLAPW